MDGLSNRDGPSVPDEIIQQAGEEFKAALSKQLNPEVREFKLRASNVGRPTCQLQMEARGVKPERYEYNHIVRMLIGDATETFLNVLISQAGIRVTGSKSRSTMNVGDTDIAGENDIEIDGKVWDIKSTSPWAFEHKWSHGWQGVYEGDTFGYVAQLYLYADGDPNRMGGWIVVNKSTGEVLVVEAMPTPNQLIEIKEKLHNTELAIKPDAPFVRQFEAEDETYYKKPTGNKVLPTICQLCQYKRPCWPNAVLQPKAMSKAEHPPLVWYTEYKEQE